MQQDKMVAFASGLHAWLGKVSCVLFLNAEVFTMIVVEAFDEVLGERSRLLIERPLYRQNIRGERYI